MNYPPYSVLLSVYKSENPEWLSIALDSMFAQTIKPAEVVLVEDGPLTDELYAVISTYKVKYPETFKTIPLKKNVGLGLALKEGVLACSNEYIARMDTDDYSVPTRIEEEFNIMFEKKVDMVGCVIDEFIGSIDNVVSHRILPETHEQIYKFAKKRTPIAHPSVLLKKTQAINCGNYGNFPFAEDFVFFVNMLRFGVKAYNIQKPLVYMRVSENFYKRRGGIKYLKSVLSINRVLLGMGWFRYHDFIIRSTMNCIVCVMPNFLRNLIYKKVLRKS